MHNIDEAKQRLLNLCQGMDYIAINNAVDAGHEHLHACMRANGVYTLAAIELLNSINSC